MSIAQRQAFLRQIPPFNRLDENTLARVAAALSLRHYSEGQTLLRRWQNPAYFFLIIDGVVEERDAEGGIDFYSAGAGFDSKSLIEGRSQHSFIAREPCSCYLLPARLFLDLTESHRELREYYYQDLARRLDALTTLQQQREAASLLSARISDGELHPALFVGAETSLHEAVGRMKAHATSALLVRHDGRVGIFTSRDVRERSLLLRLPDSTPVGELASYDLITLDRDEFLFNALVVMTKHDIRHVVITQGREIVGILEQSDLLRHLSNHSYVIACQIEHAASPEELKAAGDQILRLIKALFDKGTKARYIARLVTDLNRKLLRRLFEQRVPAALRQDLGLIVMGSEGRGEQLLRTDQDNALILRDGFACAALTEHTAAFTEALVALGYPRCPGNIMVSNPAWARSVSEYKHELFRWVHQPDDNAFLNLAIFYDAGTAAGNGALLDELKGYLLGLLEDHKVIVRHFARAILAFDTPLGLFNRLVVEKAPPHRDKLDIKKGGIFPIVHGVRSLALEYGLSETNTIARIHALSGRGPFDERFTADLIEAFDFMSMLRLRAQLANWEQGGAYDNYLDPSRLNKLERNLLRDSLKIVNEFKTYIGYHFRLSLIS